MNSAPTNMTYPRELFGQSSNHVLVFRAVQARVESYNDPTDIGTSNWHTNNSLDSPLEGPAAALEVIVRGVMNTLLPSRTSTFIHTTRQTTANVKRKFLAVVTKSKKIKFLFRSQRTAGLSVFPNQFIGRRAPGITQTARSLVSLCPRDK
jgi:hypothetical protein